MNIAGKIIFISNRNVRPGRNGLDLFGEDLNELSAEYLQEAKRWKFELLTDPSGGDPENPVSRQVFEQIMESALEKVCGYIEELSVEERRIGITLAVHSLGNYLLENYVRSNELSRETRVFDTILLNQADADNNRHAKWVQRLAQDSRVYVTINEPDRTLAFSQVINGDRLGNTVRRLKQNQVQIVVIGRYRKGLAGVCGMDDHHLRVKPLQYVGKRLSKEGVIVYQQDSHRPALHKRISWQAYHPPVEVPPASLSPPKHRVYGNQENNETGGCGYPD